MKPVHYGLLALGIAFFVGLAFGFSTKCFGADSEYWASASFTSFHTDRGAGYNEINPGLGLERRTNPNLSLGVGAYVNSFSRDTVYAGAIYTPLHLGNSLSFGAFGAAATGYPSPVIGALAAVYERDRFGFNVFALPKVSANTTGVIAFQVKMRW